MQARPRALVRARSYFAICATNSYCIQHITSSTTYEMGVDGCTRDLCLLPPPPNCTAHFLGHRAMYGGMGFRPTGGSGSVNDARATLV